MAETLFDHLTFAPDSVFSNEDTAGWGGYILGTVLRFAVDGDVSHVWWYKHAGDDTASHRIALFSIDGTLLAEAEGATPSAGWNAIAFDAPFEVTANSLYVAAIFVPGPADYTAIDGFGDADNIRGNITAPDSTEAGGQGRFRYSGEPLNPWDWIIPDQSFSNSGYGIDVTFNAGLSAISGETSSTLSDATASSAGLSIAGNNLSVTLDDVVSSSAGILSIIGSLSVTLQDLSSVISDYDPNIYYVSKTGSNSANGSSGSPWETISFGLSQISGGDVLIVRDGVYEEGISGFPSGSEGRYTILRAENKWGAKVVAGGYAGMIVDGNYVEVDGFEITNEPWGAGTDSNHGIEIQYSHHLKIHDNHVHHCGANGIGALESDNQYIYDNYVHHCGITGWNSGISIYHPDEDISSSTDDSPSRNYVGGNIVHDCYQTLMINFNSGGTTPIEVGDTVVIGPNGGTVAWVQHNSGAWASGNAAGWISIVDETSDDTPSNGTAITVGGQDRGTTTSGFYSLRGGWTDGNGIILDDWGWYQDQAGKPGGYPYGVLVENNLVVRCGGKAIQLYAVQGGSLVRNNTSYHCNRSAWQAAYGSGGSPMTWRGGISSQNPTDVTFTNNIAVAGPYPNSTAYGFYGGNGDVTFRNNLSWNGNSGQNSINTNGPNVTYVGTNLLATDPLLADPNDDYLAGDYSLSSSSPAIDAGSLVDGVPLFDLTGGERVYGGAVDLGAYEFLDAALGEGIVSALLDDASLAANASLRISATLSVVLDDVVLQGSAVISLDAALSRVLENALLDSAGSADGYGEASSSLEDGALSATGVLELAGLASSALDDATISSIGQLLLGAEFQVALDDVVVEITGGSSRTATLTIALDDASLFSTGQFIFILAVPPERMLSVGPDESRFISVGPDESRMLAVPDSDNSLVGVS